MPITIGTNIASLKTQRRVGEATDQLSRVFERLSSGQRINRASDDAAGLAISMSLNANGRILGQALRNISDTIGLTAISEGAMGALENISVRQKELAEQSANGVYSSKQRLAMDAEARALTNEYNRIILTTKFNGTDLLSQSWEEMRTQAGVGLDNSLAFKFADDLATKVTPGSYFTINSPDEAFYVWYTIDGVGTDPNADGTGVRVDLSTREIAGTADTPATTALVQGSNSDASSLSNGDMFYISSATNSYYVWFDVDGNFSDPGDLDSRGATGIRVSLTSGDTQSQVSDRIIQELTATGQFTGANYGNGDTEFTTVNPGAVLFNAYTYQGPSTVSQQSSGSDLIPGTTVHVAITGEQVRDKVATALSATGKFATQVASDGSLTVTNTVAGRAVDAADFNSGNVLVDRLTQGTGLSFVNFGDPSDVAVNFMKTADLNHDGVLDLITSSSLNQIDVRLGNGDGEFGSMSSYAVGATPQDFELRDLNGDGNLDIVNINYGSASVTVRMGTGTGSFGATSTYTVAANPREVELADLNGDGRADIITSAQGGQINVLLNQGNGTFGAASTMTGVGDIVVAGDINHDGRIDIAVTTYAGNQAFVKLGNGNGTFGATTAYALGGSGNNALVMADVNGDGWLDLGASSVFTSSASVLINNRAGGFSAPNVYSSGVDTAGVNFADLNGDGKMDLITGDYTTNIVSMRLGNGDGTFGARTSYFIGATASAYTGIYKIEVADLDQDGKVDILANDYGRSRIAMLWGNGSGGVETSRYEVTRLIFGDARGMTLINQIDLTTRKGALKALDTLDARLDRIHRQIGTMGAVTARLHSAANVTAVRRENLIAAESRIKDADIATESANYTKLQIIQQVSASVLAQANQIPALALSLLNG